MIYLYFTGRNYLPHSRWADFLDDVSSNKYSDGTPILLDEKYWPMQPWSRFLRLRSKHVAPLTRQAYGRDLHRLATHLEQSGLTFETVDDDTLPDYRDQRLRGGLSPRSWRREAVIIRSFFEYLAREGHIPKVPWDQNEKYSAVKPIPHKYDMDVRALTRKQWDIFKHVGLGGEDLDGQINESAKIKHPQRDMAAAELALTTGMRLQEWRSIILPELEKDGDKVRIELEVAAKGGRRRSLYIPEPTLRELESYITIERSRVIRRAQKGLKSKISDLAKVRSIDTATRTIKYELGGEVRKTHIRSIPLEHRRILVNEQGGRIEPLSLFLGPSGLPPSARSWNYAFSRASERMRSSREGSAVLGYRNITPHDLRHTFAVVILQGLKRQESEAGNNRDDRKTSISEHVVNNPWLRVQHLLGHSSHLTTMGYLRFVDPKDEVVQRTFANWNDPLRDYADYLRQGSNDDS